MSANHHMPVLTPVHTALHALAGEWRGREIMHPSPWDPVGGPADAHIVNRVVVGGLGVAQDYTQTRNGVASFFAHGLFRHDDSSGKYELHWVDSMGWPSKFTGALVDGVLTLTLQMPQGQMRATWDTRVPNQLSYRSEVSGDGAHWTPFMEGQYTRCAS